MNKIDLLIEVDMKIYKDSIILTFVLSVASLIISYIIKDYDLVFYSDILIGIFSGAFLTLLTSIIGYKVERKQALEMFYSYCKKHINAINKFDKGDDVEIKIDCYLDFLNKDLPDLGDAYSRIHFLFDFKRKNILYIYNEIYLPIQTLESKVKYHQSHFNWHKDGSGRNQAVMRKFCEEIDNLVFKITKSEYTEHGETIPIIGIENILFREISEELNNKYYKLMYGKKIYGREMKRHKD